MLSIEKCRKYLDNKNLSDEQIKDLRDALYVVIENIVDNYYGNIKDKCKKRSFIAEFPRKNKKEKVVA